MAECTEIYSAIARLEKKIDACCQNRVTEADVNRITQQSMLGGGVVSNALGGMVVLRGQFQNMRAEQMAVNVEKKRLEAQILALQGRVGRVEAQVGLAKAQAGTALARSGQALSKAGNAVARVASIVGAVTGVAGILTQVKILIPQLNAAESRITSLEVRELQSFQKAIAANETALKANKLAAAAKASADVAALNAIDANRKAGSALQLATLAKQIAEVAIGESSNAQKLARKALGLSENAIKTAVDALKQIPPIRAIAIDAKATAVAANSKADSALQQIPPVRAIANTANAKADNANSKADSALQQIPPVRAIANTASSKADNANSKADSALKQIPPVRAIALTASTKADNANSKADDAKRVASFGATLAQSAVNVAGSAKTTANTANAKAEKALGEIALIRSATKTVNNYYQQIREEVPRIIRKVSETSTQIVQTRKIAWHTTEIVNVADAKAERAANQVKVYGAPIKANTQAITQLKAENQVTKQVIQQVKTEGQQVTRDDTGLIKEIDKIIEKRDRELKYALPAIVAGGAALLTPSLINATKQGIQQSASTISAAAATGYCKTTAPGGCTTKALDDFGDRFGNKLGDKLLDGYNAAANTIQMPMLGRIQSSINRVDAKVTGNGSRLGQILDRLNSFREFAADKFDKLYKALGLDRAVQLMTLAASLHNASMLSVSLKDTLLETTANIMAVVGIKDAEGSALDLNEIFGKQLEDLIKSIVGEQTYTNTKTLWLKANRIISTASNLLWSFQSMQHTLTSGVEVVGGWVAKIGNNMKDEGLVSDRAYGWFNENPNFKNPVLTYMEKLDNLDEAASQINQLASTILEFKQTGDQIKTQKAELDKQISDFDKTRAAIDAQKDTQSTPKTITSTDLLKHEPE